MAHYPELLVKPLHGEAYRYSLDKDVISIGRSKRNDLVLADQWLSRHHAEIRNSNGSYCISDLESRNGTYVNGERISSTITLQNTDIITLGDQQLTFLNEKSEPVVLVDDDGPSGFDMEGTVVVPTAPCNPASRSA